MSSHHHHGLHCDSTRENKSNFKKKKTGSSIDYIRSNVDDGLMDRWYCMIMLKDAYLPFRKKFELKKEEDSTVYTSQVDV